MLTLSDPHDLKPSEAYRQARLVAAKTSRARDRNWYRSAFELPCQWHLWFDGGRRVLSATYSAQDSRWRIGPELPLASLTTGDGAADFLERLAGSEFFSQRPRALGVVLHAADEFMLAELEASDGGEDADNLRMLHYRLIEDPRSVLIDREVNEEASSWRLLPFWGALAGKSRCIAVALPRAREGFLAELVAQGERRHLPVRVAITCAPVECAAVLPMLAPDMNGGHLVAVLYAKFTAVFAFAANGELRRARSLTHRNNHPCPHGFGEILWGLAIGEELAANDGNGGGAPVQVLLLSDNAEAMAAARSQLQNDTGTGRRLQVRELNFADIPSLAEIPCQRPEFLAHDRKAVAEALHGDGSRERSETFQGLTRQWGAHCNYYDADKHDALYPAISDLRFLRCAQVLVMLLALALTAAAGYGVYSYVSAVRHPSWDLTAQQIKRTEETLAKLQLEKRQMTTTGLLLQPRSRGWVVLEFLMQTFPEDSEVRLEGFSYSMEAERPKPKAAALDEQKLGFIRTWSFKGLAKEKGLERLGSLNSQRGLNALFAQVGEATGDASYAPDPARQLRIALTQGRNPKYSSSQIGTDGAHDPAREYPFSFDAVITQNVGEEDVLALPVPKPF